MVMMHIIISEMLPTITKIDAHLLRFSGSSFMTFVRMYMADIINSLLYSIGYFLHIKEKIKAVMMMVYFNMNILLYCCSFCMVMSILHKIFFMVLPFWW